MLCTLPISAIIIQRAVWLYFRFPLSFRDVEEMLFERGIDVSYETIRQWVLKFGPAIATKVRSRLVQPLGTGHLDEVIVRIAGMRSRCANGYISCTGIRSQRREILEGAALEARAVVEFWNLTKIHGLTISIDGGWAVDAVLGRQTRPHNDLDIALPASEVARLKHLLAGLGFTQVARPNSWEHNVVYETAQGLVLDVHSYILSLDGSNAGGVAYIAEHLCGEGVILGTKMRCVPPEWLVQFHTGYDVDEGDWRDVRLLCERFDIAVPKAYDRFIDSEPKI